MVFSQRLAKAQICMSVASARGLKSRPGAINSRRCVRESLPIRRPRERPEAPQGTVVWSRKSITSITGIPYLRDRGQQLEATGNSWTLDKFEGVFKFAVIHYLQHRNRCYSYASATNVHCICIVGDVKSSVFGVCNGRGYALCRLAWRYDLNSMAKINLRDCRYALFWELSTAVIAPITCYITICYITI